MSEQLDGIRSYLREIGKHRVLTKDEEFALFERLHNGDETAREEIIRCNLRLVVRLALRFQHKGLALEDLIQEGNIGLMDVIDRFDHHLGFRFSTYAAFWIRQAIQVALRRNGSLIRLPVRKARMLGKMNEIVNEYQALHGRQPTREEVAEGLDLTPEQVDELTQISHTAVSFDAPLDEDGGTLKDRVADEGAELASQATMRREMSRKVRGVLSQLSEREHSILKLRYGFVAHRPLSLRTISRHVGLSQEGVRRVEQRALAKLGRTHLREQLSGLL